MSAVYLQSVRKNLTNTSGEELLLSIVPHDVSVEQRITENHGFFAQSLNDEKISVFSYGMNSQTWAGFQTKVFLGNQS